MKPNLLSFSTFRSDQFSNLGYRLQSADLVIGTHVLEQYADNKLIRPRAEYVGERNTPYVPIDQR